VQLALRGLRIEPGAEVLLAGYDFPGNFRSIEAVGATPVLVDVDPRNWNLAPEPLDSACSPQTRAVLVSHLHGGLVPMRQLVAWARERRLAIIEDVCQAPGAIVEGRLAGTWGDVGVLSFGGSKLLTAGRGGAIITSHAEVHQRAKIFCEQGNHAFPLSELQATVLLPQLARLHQHNQRRTASVELLRQALSDVSCLKPLENTAADCQSVYYKLGFQFDADAAGCSREAFVSAAQAAGIPVDAGFRGFLNRGPRRCRRAGTLAEAARAAAGAVVLHHPVLLQSEKIIEQLGVALLSVCERLPGAVEAPTKAEASEETS
jgi:dTDP-4-amino-4,6-dideoxygalactose transaminase